VILDFYRARGFALERMTTAGGSVGCNEFVMRKGDAAVASGPHTGIG
jgi:hypothetical protein